MANCCSNWVEITGDPEDVRKFVDLVGGSFNFDKVIPTQTDTRDEANEKWGCSSIAFDVDMNIDDVDDGEASWTFWTKWNPPKLVYQKLVEMFPNLFIYWRYEEPGCGLYGYLQNED